MQPNTTYASYLLRLRQVQSDTATRWVASVQSTATGEQRSFSSVDALIRFLEIEYGECDARGATRHLAGCQEICKCD